VAGLKIEAEKPNYMFLSLHQNPGQNHNLLIANKSSRSQ